MTKKTFSALVSKEIGGSLTRKEQEELHRSLSKDRKLKEVYDEIHTFMRDKQYDETDIDVKLDEVWHKINTFDEIQHTNHKTPIWRKVTKSVGLNNPFNAVFDENVIPLNNPSAKKRIVSLWVRVAATIAILIGLGLLAYNYLPEQQNIYTQTLQAGNENLYAVLDDGTQVWLGKHSQIDYNDNFGKKNRKIQLTGEAFFDVAHNAEVPLTVTANEVEVLVKGTAFNVNASRDDVEVALLRGLVAVKSTKQKHEREILLHPNQKILVRNGKVASNDSNYVVLDMQSVKDSTITEIKWMDDVLVFHKQRFADLAKLMESRFEVKITFLNPAIAEQRFTGSIKTETLPQILDALKQSYPFEYEITDKSVTIK